MWTILTSNLREVPLNPRRSSKPFFEDPDCKAAIDHLGSEPQLAVYTGAGLTIDRSQHNWDTLVRALLKVVKVPVEAVNALHELYEPDQLASIAFQKLQIEFPGSHWTAKIQEIIDSLIYQSGEWKSGQASSELAGLAKALSGPGRHLTVLTSNYDTFYELELARLLDAPVVAVLDTTAGGSQPVNNSVQEQSPQDLIYLHGIIPGRGQDLPEVPTNIILSERQYVESAALEHRILTEVINDRSLLIYGSSLVDRPLLRSLAEPHQAGKRRIALLPNAGLGIEHYDQTLEQLQDGVRCRLEQFDTETLFPDFYGQAAQFLVEIRSCIEYKPQHGVAYDADNCNYNYGARLAAWWNAWWTERSRNEVDFQYADHRKLAELMQVVHRALKRPRAKVKIELWVRWKPGTASRQLKLWASSSGPWSDKDTMRTAVIEQKSNIIAVNAFCEGRPLLGPRLDNHRWLRHFAVPLFFRHPYGKVPVGTIVVAVLAGDKRIESQFDEGNTLALNILTQDLKDEGETIVAAEVRV